MVMVHYGEVSPPANNVATSHYGHHEQWDLPQHFRDLKQSSRLRTRLIRLIVNTYTKAGQSSFRIASVVTLGIDEPSHQPDSSGNWEGGKLKEEKHENYFFTGSVFWELNSSQNLQDQEQREMLNEILMGSLESLTI